MIAGPGVSARGSRGFASVLALVLLCVMAAMAVAVFAATNMNAKTASNGQDVFQARTAAESGLAFLVRRATHCGVSGSQRGQALLDAIASRLSADLIGTANLPAGGVTYDGSTIAISEIDLGDGQSFSSFITLASYDTVRFHVTGRFTRGTGDRAKTGVRQVALDLRATGNPAFGLGICSQGPVAMANNSAVIGAVLASDGSIHSGAAGTAISIVSGEISGDVSVSTAGAAIDLGGAVVGGDVRYDAPPVTMPQLDRAAYRALATRVVDASTDTSSGTFDNIVIRANTNPQFGNVTIRGVMYVEAPNRVEFANNLDFTGVIVADDPPTDLPDTASYISFVNNTSLLGPGSLPDLPQFSSVRNMGGSSVLAPGFTMEFKNDFGSIGGVVAVKNLIAKNNLSVLCGGILVYGNGGLTLKNNSTITVDLSGCTGTPPGFVSSGPALTTEPASYQEL